MICPTGEREAGETERMIDRVRTFAGYREYPKYGIVSRYFVHERALLEQAERLVRADVLPDKEDVFYLTFRERRDVVSIRRADHRLIRRRKEAFRSHQALTPSRVLTSDGEVIAGAHRRDDVPNGALIGLAVSAGTVEGRARVIGDLAQPTSNPATSSSPPTPIPAGHPCSSRSKAWSRRPGGLMTHGAVIAREYGLPTSWESNGPPS